VLIPSSAVYSFLHQSRPIERRILALKPNDADAAALFPRVARLS